MSPRTPYSAFTKPTAIQQNTVVGLWSVVRARIVALLCLLFLCTVSFSQDQRLHYAINRNGKKVGDLHFQRSQAGARTVYNVQSDVKVTMLISVRVDAKEQSVYENDLLQSSSLVRHVNGHERSNKQIKSNGKGLMVDDGGEQRELKNFSVRYNTHCLYTLEPLLFSNVFADNYQQFIPIIKVRDHQYRLSFPDGNSNEYFYENGVCKRVVVKSQLFNAEFVLQSL